MTGRSMRWGALAGTAYVVLIMVGNAMNVSGESGRTDAARILADVQNQANAVNQAGLVLELLGFVAYLFFLGALYRAMRTAEGAHGWLSDAAFGAGLCAVAVKIASAAPMMAASYRRDELSPELARTLVDLGGAAFILSGLLTAVFVLAAASSAHASGLLPHWLTRSGIVVSVVGFVTPLVGAVSPSDYVPVPFLLCLVWVAVTGIVLARRPLVTARRDDSSGSAARSTAAARA